MLAQVTIPAKHPNHPRMIRFGTNPSRLPMRKPTATSPTLPVPSLRATQTQASLSEQQGLSQSEKQVFTPLTKARKTNKQSKSVASPSRLAMAGTAAGYAAMAVGAGAAVTVLALNASQVAVASAALAAGAAVLPAAGRGVTGRARRSVSGRAAPLFGAMSRGMSAAQNFTRACNSRAVSTQPAPLQRLAATSRQSAGETTSADPQVIQPLEIEVVYEPSVPVEQDPEEDFMRRLLEQFSDEEWRQLAKVIQAQPCQVLLDSAMQFAEQFDPAYQLPGETVDPTPRIDSQQLKAQLEHSADQSDRKERLKHKEKKKRKKRRKAV